MLRVSLLVSLTVALPLAGCKSDRAQPAETTSAEPPAPAEPQRDRPMVASGAASRYRFDVDTPPESVKRLPMGALLGFDPLGPKFLEALQISGRGVASAGLIDKSTLAATLAATVPPAEPPRVTNELILPLQDVANAKTRMISWFETAGVPAFEIRPDTTDEGLAQLSAAIPAFATHPAVRALAPAFIIVGPGARGFGLARITGDHLVIRAGFPGLPEAWDVHPFVDDPALEAIGFFNCKSASVSTYEASRRFAQTTALLGGYLGITAGDPKDAPAQWQQLTAEVGTIASVDEIKPRLFDLHYRCGATLGWGLSDAGLKIAGAVADKGLITVGAISDRITASGPLISGEALQSWVASAGPASMDLIRVFFTPNAVASGALPGEADPSTVLGTLLADRRLLIAPAR